MKFMKIAALLAAVAFPTVALVGVATIAHAQFAEAQQSGGPMAIGQVAAQVDQQGHVAIIQAPPSEAKPATGGGIISLSAFGWLEPYIDTVVQGLIVVFFGWLGKSKYGQWMDETSRDALQTFVKNRASSLIADGAVRMQDKSIQVDNRLLFKAASEASTAIPDALKRFKLSPDVVAAKIIDAIPQTEAGAAIVAASHAENDNAPVPVTDRPSASPEVAAPNNSAAAA